MKLFRQLLKSEKPSELENQFSKLRQINQKLLLILQTIPKGIFAAEPDGTIFFWSKGATELTGIEAPEALGKSFQKILPLTFMGEKQVQPLLKLFETRKTLKYEYKLNLSFKKQIPVLLTFTPLLTDEKLLGVLVEIEDISERRRLEQLKIDFVSMVSHELRTPISNIKGYLDVVLREAKTLSDEHRKFLKRAFLCNERQLNTIESLLNASDLERGTVKMEIIPLQVQNIISSVASEWKPLAQEKRLNLKFIYPRFTLPKVLADEEKLREVLVNLVSNAAKYTQKGSIIIETSFEDNKLVISVADTGPGIPIKEQEHLFEKFQRGERVLSEETQGTGLGLHIAKSFVELMGGRIWVESKVDKGSKFSFSLLVAEAPLK